jgi:hypothetical protein
LTLVSEIWQGWWIVPEFVYCGERVDVGDGGVEIGAELLSSWSDPYRYIYVGFNSLYPHLIHVVSLSNFGDQKQWSVYIIPFGVVCKGQI